MVDTDGENVSLERNGLGGIQKEFKTSEIIVIPSIMNHIDFVLITHLQRQEDRDRSLKIAGPFVVDLFSHIRVKFAICWAAIKL